MILSPRKEGEGIRRGNMSEEKQQLLIVDDEEINRTILSMMFDAD